MNPKSTYFFMGKIYDRLARFQVQQETLKDNLFLEVFLDGITIWGTTTMPFDEFYPKIREIFSILFSAYTFRTKKPVIYILDSWVEAKEVDAKKNMVGWIHSPQVLTPTTVKSRVNTPWKKSAWLWRNISRGNENHKIALKDYRSALTDTSEDAFLFAYRAIEDICRAVSGRDDVDATAWTAMHRILGTTRGQINPLKEVADRVRHGNITDPIVTSARLNKNSLINIAHDIMKAEFIRTFPGFF